MAMACAVPSDVAATAVGWKDVPLKPLAPAVPAKLAIPSRATTGRLGMLPVPRPTGKMVAEPFMLPAAVVDAVGDDASAVTVRVIGVPLEQLIVPVGGLVSFLATEDPADQYTSPAALAVKAVVLGSALTT